MTDRFVLLEVIVTWMEEGGIEKVAPLSKIVVNTSAIQSVEPRPLNDEPRRWSEGPRIELWALSVKLSDGSSFLARAVDPYGNALETSVSHDEVMEYALRYLSGERSR